MLTVSLDQADKVFPDILRNEDVIGGDARLASVKELAGYDAFRSRSQHGVAANDRGRLPAELERDRHQVFGCGPHDPSANFGGAGIQQVIEGQCGERGAHVGAAKNSGDLFLGKQPSKKVHQKVRGATRQLRRLEHDAIARRQCRDQRQESKLAESDSSRG